MGAAAREEQHMLLGMGVCNIYMISNMTSYPRYGIIHDIIYIRSDIIGNSVISYKIYGIIINIMMSYMMSYMMPYVISDTKHMI